MTKKKNQTKDEEIVKNDMREKNMRERENTLKVSEEERVSENNARKERERESTSTQNYGTKKSVDKSTDDNSNFKPLEIGNT